MPKPHVVFDPFTGRKRATVGDVIRSEFASKRDADESIERIASVTERQGRAILRGRGTVSGRRIA